MNEFQAFLAQPDADPNARPMTWLKDDRGRYVEGNLAYRQFLGVHKAGDLERHTDAKWFPEDLSHQYQAGDQATFRGSSILRRLELVPNVSGALIWHLCTKEPRFGKHGRIIATCGTMVAIADAPLWLGGDPRLLDVIGMITDQFSEPITIAGLADRVGISKSQLSRRFRKTLGESPRQFLLRVRLLAGSQLLAQSSLSGVEVAFRVGFYDQSHFHHAFKRSFGVSPTQYRKRFGQV